MAQLQQDSQLLRTEQLQQLEGARIAYVYTEWNDLIIKALMEGSDRVAESLGARVVSRIAVPGSVELTYACRRLWELESPFSEEAPEAIIAFGAVIRGGTPHFEYVCQSVTDGITQLNLSLPIPVIFGVLTLDTEAQAWERLGGSHGHKGEEMALTALKMIALNRELMSRSRT
jgi:6,7-dimethyl-8-ribityllumazine synthase